MARLMSPRRVRNEETALHALRQEMRAVARRLAQATRPTVRARQLAWQPVARRPRLRLLRGGLWNGR